MFSKRNVTLVTKNRCIDVNELAQPHFHWFVRLRRLNAHTAGHRSQVTSIINLLRYKLPFKTFKQCACFILHVLVNVSF